MTGVAGSEGKLDDKLIQDNPPVEVRAFGTYLNFWLQCNTTSDEEMKKLEALNAQLKALNAVLTPLGTLDSTIGDKRDNAALIKALDARPDLLYAVNAAMKEAGLKLFSKTEPNKSGIFSEHFGLTYDPGKSADRDAKVPADLIPEMFEWSVKEQMTAGAIDWNPLYRKVFENLLGKNAPNNPKDVSANDWKDLAKKMYFDYSTVPSAIPIPARSMQRHYDVGQKKWGVKIEEKVLWIGSRNNLTTEELQSVCQDVDKRLAAAMDWEMSIRTFGGLNKSFDGPAVYKALQEVKAKIGDVSNQLQARSVDVNAALQKTSAAMNAVVELINRLFGALGKILA